MRMLLLILICFAVTPAIAAEALRLPATGQGGKTLPLKGTGGSEKADSCASYGRGFRMVEGTCVKIGGSISVDTAIRR
ncbi:hypothetical protein JQ625_11005 [Bradyrhizobium diazoefficiens]|nr:hypothetical protein [Bradyrhizobium diazoefficiens]MBR0775359.1 hypothetical protein [Bradyrhizobium diazoefficiens]